MSLIDNDDPLFQFDAIEGIENLGTSSGLYFQAIPSSSPPSFTMATRPSPTTQAFDGHVFGSLDKGKAVSRPISIPLSVAANTIHDDFIMPLPFDPSSFASSSSISSSYPDIFTPSTSFTSMTFAQPSEEIDYLSEDIHYDAKGKGKARESLPSLPALSLSPSEFDQDPMDWLSSPIDIPVMSPPTTSNSPVVGRLLLIESEAVAVSPTPADDRVPARARSLSNHSPRSMSVSRKPFGSPPSGTTTLARKIFSRRKTDALILDLPEPINLQYDVQNGTEACPVPWHASAKYITSPADSSISNLRTLREKGRSYSTPQSIAPFDLATSFSSDAFAAAAKPVILRNNFEELLPRELQLTILQALVSLHEEEYARAIAEGRWSCSLASSSKNKWVGKAKGIRELFKLSRVSKYWHHLVLDGHLWTHLDLQRFPQLSRLVLTRLTAMGGGFVSTIDFTGHVHLTSSTLINIGDNLRVASHPDATPYTQLTALNLRGCSGLKTHALHHILMQSPCLQTICVMGLAAVTNGIFDILAAHCRMVESFDAGRCRNMDASGLKKWASAALARGDQLLLRELRVSGLKYVDDRMMSILGQATPLLEVLDLNYSRGLHNSALDAFVACALDEGTERLGTETVVLYARDLGRDSNDSNRYRRRVTRLRHLSLSNCILLTDTVCSNLAFSVPNLEFLELAGLGGDLKDDGLIRLLGTTPHIRRLDIEDAADITDAVLEALTPAGPTQALNAETDPEPGYALEHLIVSSAGRITDDAVVALIRNCSKLRVLEADSTRIGIHVMREFVQLSRKRSMLNAKIVAVDCRGVNEALVKELAPFSRPRIGWRSYDARKLKYLDIRDGDLEDLKIGQDECDERRVAFKTFYSWQTVDAVISARDKRRKATTRRRANESFAGNESDDITSPTPKRVTRWWSPSSSGRSTPRTPPTLTDLGSDSCTIM